MASLSKKSPTNLKLLLLTIFFSYQNLPVSSFEFQADGSEGWIVPPSNDNKIYNDWASQNRFEVDDIICFKYRKDSVMEVKEEDYKKCNSSHPNFFSNIGNTVFRFDHSGPFYFISGVSGHCEKGQRMIIKVMAAEEESGSLCSPGKSSGSRSAVLSVGVYKITIFVLPCVASNYYLL